jgi:uncharacterized membrane protein
MLLISLRFVTLMLAALTTGMSFAHVLERPAKMGYDATLYATLQKTLYAYWGPPNIGAVVEIASIAATLLLAWFVRDQEAPLWMTAGAAVALLIAYPVVFFVFVAPANKAFLAATPAAMPADWTKLRARWEEGHTIRFAFQLGALGLLILSVLVELEG